MKTSNTETNNTENSKGIKGRKPSVGKLLTKYLQKNGKRLTAEDVQAGVTALANVNLEAANSAVAALKQNIVVPAVAAGNKSAV